VNILFGGRTIVSASLCLAFLALPLLSLGAVSASSGSGFFVVNGSGTSGGQTFVCPGGVYSNFFSSDITIRANSASANPVKGSGSVVISGNIPEQGTFTIRVTIFSGNVDRTDRHFVLSGRETFVQCGIIMKAGASVVLSGTCGQNAMINFVAPAPKQHGSWFGPVSCS
jgi:hypothetical protein